MVKKQTIPKEEIEKLRDEAEKLLNYARQQAAFWIRKVEQLTGSLVRGFWQ